MALEKLLQARLVEQARGRLGQQRTTKYTTSSLQLERLERYRLTSRLRLMVLHTESRYTQPLRRVYEQEDVLRSS